jgi:hypothetical protein
MRQPTRWSKEQIQADALTAREEFRRERTGEPLEQYTAFFDQFSKIFVELVDKLGSFASDADPEKLVQIVGDANLHTALRYTTAPPISEDDLRVLADSKLSAKALRSDPDSAKRVREILLSIIDEHRFPWIKENREPNSTEKRIAIVSSAALVAARKVETSRRSTATRTQELAVRQLLSEMGFIQQKRRTIHLLSDAPPSGHYCPESLLGGTRADLVIGLYDGRVLAIECKASNSQVNSFKRVNHEALGKAQKWLTAFGKNATVPAAILSGVFNVANLESAQDGGLNLFWSHRLMDLVEFIESTK